MKWEKSCKSVAGKAEILLLLNVVFGDAVTGCPSATCPKQISHTLSSEGPVTNRLSHDTAIIDVME
jgi:hypothetical protein